MFRILYRFLGALVTLAVWSGRSKDLEIIVLRHQLMVLRRQDDRPAIDDNDRTLLGAIAAALPRRLRQGWIVTPETLLRWHRRRIARHWTQPSRRPGRPSTAAKIRQLIVEMATSNLSNFLLVSGTGSTGEPIGVSPSMAAAVADALGRPLELVMSDSPGELADAVTSDQWDIGNIGADPARAEHIAFGGPYCEIESTYLVRGDSPIVTAADVDRAGVRIATKQRAAYSLWLKRNIEHAQLVQTDTIDDSFDTLAAEEVDVLAGLRAQLLGVAERLPGSRVLEGRFASVQQAIGIPRQRHAAGLAYLERLVAAAIESGFVAALIGHHDARGLSVAPAP